MASIIQRGRGQLPRLVTVSGGTAGATTFSRRGASVGSTAAGRSATGAGWAAVSRAASGPLQIRKLRCLPVLVHEQMHAGGAEVKLDLRLHRGGGSGVKKGRRQLFRLRDIGRPQQNGDAFDRVFCKAHALDSLIMVLWRRRGEFAPFAPSLSKDSTGSGRGWHAVSKAWHCLHVQ